MTAQELRIGNWVLWGESKFEIKVDSIYHKCIRWDNSDENSEIEYEYLYPIPLTPEILEKAGFEKGKHIYIKGADLLALKDGYYYGFTDNEYGFDLENSTKIIYLHQLQNLYFALTGEELNIEL